MAAMPELISPTAAAINRWYEDNEKPRDSARIGASSIGEECERSIWYSFRWASPLENFDGRKLRLFNTGHREESRMLDDLRNIGVHVQAENPMTGQQWEETISGVIVSKLDGKAIGVPGAEKVVHAVEIKTMSGKNFQEWRRKGLEKFSPKYWAQVHTGHEAHGLSRTLFMAKNKDTDEIETERVKYDPLISARLVAKGERIAFSDRPPVKSEGFSCRWCKHEKICRYDAFARTNCRTCLHVSIERDGQWRCTSTGATLTLDQQQAGCPAHRWVPDLVPGEQIDVEGDAVTYALRLNGQPWTDGVDAKPIIPQVARSAP